MVYQPFFWFFNAKAMLVKEEQWYYLTHSWRDKGIPIFLKGIRPNVNVITQLEFELTYYDAAVQLVSYYTMGTPPY